MANITHRLNHLRQRQWSWTGPQWRTWRPQEGRRIWWQMYLRWCICMSQTGGKKGRNIWKRNVVVAGRHGGFHVGLENIIWGNTNTEEKWRLWLGSRGKKYSCGKCKYRSEKEEILLLGNRYFFPLQAVSTPPINSSVSTSPFWKQKTWKFKWFLQSERKWILTFQCLSTYD